MRILITGGAGFIGSHLAERLLRNSHELSIVDDLNPFYSPALKIENLEAISQVGAIDFHKMDICDESSIMALVEELRPEAIIHLAARAGVRPSLENPVLYERTNVGGTTVLLEAARRASVQKFVFASSSSIYGATNNVPFSEADYNNLPVSPYAATKLGGEKICYTYAHLYGMSITCLRLFTVYGPRQRPDLAIRKFTSLILDDKPIPVFGDGTTGRDYTYVDDIVSGIEAALLYQASYEIFNLGNSSPVTLELLIETLQTELGVRAKTQRLSEQPGDVPITYADISKASRLLGYKPMTPFAEGIRKFVSWYRTRPQKVA